jgi:hypothetical protein
VPVIYRDSGLRFITYVDDHLPAHVHVEGQGGSAKIAIDDASLVWSRNLGRRDVIRAMDVVSRLRTEFGIAWQNIHG